MRIRQAARNIAGKSACFLSFRFPGLFPEADCFEASAYVEALAEEIKGKKEQFSDIPQPVLFFIYGCVCLLDNLLVSAAWELGKQQRLLQI